MASEEDKRSFQERVNEALEKGLPIPEFPNTTPLRGLALATQELVEEYEKAEFSRWEALYLAMATMNGTPGSFPK